MSSHKSKFKKFNPRDVKNNNSITVDPNKNINVQMTPWERSKLANERAELLKDLDAGITTNNTTVSTTSSNSTVPIGTVNSARINFADDRLNSPNINPADSMNALDVISEQNYYHNINNTKERLELAEWVQNNKLENLDASATTAISNSTTKTENKQKESNVEKNNVQDNQQLIDELDEGIEKGSNKTNSNSTIKKSSKPAETGEKRLQAGLDIFNDTNFMQNVLHDYESVTYDITWALAGKKFMAEFFERENALRAGYSTSNEFFDFSTDKDPNMLLKESGEMISILSRTGETITTITNLEMENTFGLTRADRVNTAALIRFSVTQPQSTNLIKQIWLASQELGIERYQQHPFLIQVYLKGRKKDGTLVGDYKPVKADNERNLGIQSASGIEIPGTRRLYAIMIRNITYRVEAGGAVYQIEAIRYGDIGKADDHQLIADMKISNIKKFKDFTDGFANELALQEQHNLGVTKYLLDKYSFSITGSNEDITGITESRIVTDAEKNKHVIFGKDLDNPTVTTEIDYDSSITEVLEKHLARTTFMVDKIKGIQEQLADIDKDAVEKWDEIAITKKAFTITAHAMPMGFDSLRQDYQRHFHYVIAVSDWATIQSGIIQEYQAPETRHKQRVSTIMENALIDKKYNYLFTGDNIDVLEFNLDFNYQYVYPYDQLHGVFKRLPEATMIKFQENATEEANKKQVSNEMKLTFSKAAEDGVISGAEHKQILQARKFFLENYTEQLQNGAVEPDGGTLTAYQNLINEYNKDIQQYNIKQGDAGIKLKEVERFNDFGKTADNKGLEITIGAKWRLAEKLDNDNVNLSEDALTKLNVQFYGRAVNTHDGMTDAGSSENAEAQRVLENSFAGGPGIDLMSVTMDIIGDPYWLPRPEIDTLEKVLQNLGVSADPKYENMILFQTMYPEEVDPGTGLIPPVSERRDEILTGIYRIYKIEHRFEGGQFTQRLHLQRDVLTDLSFVVNQRRN